MDDLPWESPLIFKDVHSEDVIYSDVFYTNLEPPNMSNLPTHVIPALNRLGDLPDDQLTQLVHWVHATNPINVFNVVKTLRHIVNQPVFVEIVQQPPKRIVYKRPIRPSPGITLPKLKEAYILQIHLINSTTGEEMEGLNPGTLRVEDNIAYFDDLTVQYTSHKTKCDFKLRFDISLNNILVTSVLSDNFTVFSHVGYVTGRTYLNRGWEMPDEIDTSRMKDIDPFNSQSSESVKGIVYPKRKKEHR